MWNDERVLSVKGKKILIYCISSLITVALFFVFYKLLDSREETNIEIYISAIAVVLTIVGYILSITNDLISQQMDTKLILTLSTDIVGSHVVISCSVENKGLDRIDNMHFFLFVDQPILKTDFGIYQSNHILKHDCNHKYNCMLSEMCKADEIDGYPTGFMIQEPSDLYYCAKKLDFLSPVSILYINPGECFSEDVVMKLNKGVYRVLLIGIYGKRKQGCSCANKQFVVE